jgi:hypothetical protein
MQAVILEVRERTRQGREVPVTGRIGSHAVFSRHEAGQSAPWHEQVLYPWEQVGPHLVELVHGPHSRNRPAGVRVRAPPRAGLVSPHNFRVAAEYRGSDVVPATDFLAPDTSFRRSIRFVRYRKRDGIGS